MRPLIRRIVAGVATLRTDDPALAAALRVSTRLGAELHLVHVDAAASRPATRLAELREMAEAAEPGAVTGGRVTCHVVAGPADRRLLEVAEAMDADLLVLGATRRGIVAGVVLGTTAGRLLRGTRIPVLVAPEPLPDRPLRVLLATDLSHHSTHAHSHGGALARALSAPGEPEMRSLFVEPPPLPEAPLSRTPPGVDPLSELAEFLAAEVPRSPSMPCVRSGDPAVQIVREAREWDADLLVLGTHGRRGAMCLFLGSVAETVLRHAPCPTLVIPPLRSYRMEADHAGAAREPVALAGTPPAA